MIGLADFDLHVRRQCGGQSQPRAKNLEDQRIAKLDEFHAPAEAHAERFEALHLLVVGCDLADDGADARRELIQPDEFGLNCVCHSGGKISCPARKSTQACMLVDANGWNMFFIRLQYNRRSAVRLPVACGFLSVNCGWIIRGSEREFAPIKGGADTSAAAQGI